MHAATRALAALAISAAPLTITDMTTPTAHAGFTNNILITGYWPPTNNMVRRFSTNPDQNPAGWQGDNWNNTGFNIHSYFPEFPSPPNPPSQWGAGEGDLTVDYQDTMADWEQIVSDVKPAAIITFSRGRSGSNWELEGRLRMWEADQWISDYQAPFKPSPDMPIFDDLTPGTWYDSYLPLNDITTAVENTGVFAPGNVFTDTSGAGRFLSEFIGLLGTRHHLLNQAPDAQFRSFAAGHIHVGINTPDSVANAATDATLLALTDYLNTVIPAPPTATLLAAAAIAANRRRRK